MGECVIGIEHFGFSISGAAAEFFVAKEAWLHPLPDNLSWTQGALVEPFSCGYYATLRADNLDASDTVVVLGAGPIGLGVVAACVAKGARVIVAEPSKSRGDLARALGADSVLDPLADGYVEAVRELTDGRGASVVFEASGKPAAMATALEVAGFRARLVFIGIDVGGRAAAPLGLIQSKELQLRGIIGSPGVWPQTLKFLARSGLDLSPLVTSTYRLADATSAVDAVLGDPSQVKVTSPRPSSRAATGAHRESGSAVRSRRPPGGGPTGTPLRAGRGGHRGRLQRALRHRRHRVCQRPHDGAA